VPDIPTITSVASLVNNTALNPAFTGATSYALSDSYLTVGQVTPGDLSVAPSLYTYMYLQDGTGYWVGFIVDYTSNEVSAQWSDGSAHLTSVQFDPVAHRYFRVGESSSTVYWETSADGAVFSPVWAQPKSSVGSILNLASLKVKIGNSTKSNEASSTTSSWDRIEWTALAS
jgi:hypothetical protein